MIQRLAYLAKLLGISSLGFFDTLLKVDLNLAQRFQSGDEIVVEYAKVCVWLSFGLTTFLLQSQLGYKPSQEPPKQQTYRRLVNTKNLVHVLIDCE